MERPRFGVNNRDFEASESMLSELDAVKLESGKLWSKYIFVVSGKSVDSSSVRISSGIMKT